MKFGIRTTNSGSNMRIPMPPTVTLTTADRTTGTAASEAQAAANDANLNENIVVGRVGVKSESTGASEALRSRWWGMWGDASNYAMKRSHHIPRMLGGR